MTDMEPDFGIGDTRRDETRCEEYEPRPHTCPNCDSPCDYGFCDDCKLECEAANTEWIQRQPEYMQGFLAVYAATAALKRGVKVVQELTNRARVEGVRIDIKLSAPRCPSCGTLVNHAGQDCCKGKGWSGLDG